MKVIRYISDNYITLTTLGSYAHCSTVSVQVRTLTVLHCHEKADNKNCDPVFERLLNYGPFKNVVGIAYW